MKARLLGLFVAAADLLLGASTCRREQLTAALDYTSGTTQTVRRDATNTGKTPLCRGARPS